MLTVACSSALSLLQACVLTRNPVDLVLKKRKKESGKTHPKGFSFSHSLSYRLYSPLSVFPNVFVYCTCCVSACVLGVFVHVLADVLVSEEQEKNCFVKPHSTPTTETYKRKKKQPLIYQV